ncbi:hypothetical protein GY45DRAFT_981250 [Cubamyces sp. BRFM 1775]|nr:hypothetical protein GY45DRAFT_981250 [Cubamyces sp. BRFM 1775]
MMIPDGHCGRLAGADAGAPVVIKKTLSVQLPVWSHTTPHRFSQRAEAASASTAKGNCSSREGEGVPASQTVAISLLCLLASAISCSEPCSQFRIFNLSRARLLGWGGGPPLGAQHSNRSPLYYKAPRYPDRAGIPPSGAPPPTPRPPLDALGGLLQPQVLFRTLLHTTAAAAQQSVHLYSCYSPACCPGCVPVSLIFV